MNAENRLTPPQNAPLIHFCNARRELELASSIDEVKQIRDKAEALRLYVKQQGESLHMQNRCAEIKLRAERKAGELLADRDKHPAGRPAENRFHDATNLPPRLTDLGISKSQSSRWQSVASLPEDVFETHVRETVQAEKELTTADTLRLAKNLRKAEKLAEFESRNPREAAFSRLEALIEAGQRFGTIYADPPWAYENQATRAATGNHYPTMTPAEIAALPIAQLAADQAHLHLWTTHSFVYETKEIIEAWGFTYKSQLVWIKPQIGLGNYWRTAHETLILGVKGNVSFADHSFRSWIQAERTQHSEKPQHIRGMIEKVSPAPRLELFARKAYPGWSAWGNEVDR